MMVMMVGIEDVGVHDRPGIVDGIAERGILHDTGRGLPDVLRTIDVIEATG